MKKDYTVQINYLPGEKGKAKDSKDRYFNFHSFEEAMDKILSIAKEHNLPITKENFKVDEEGDYRFGGRTNQKNEKGEWIFEDYCICLTVGLLMENIIKGLNSGELKLDTRGHNHISIQEGKIKEFYLKELTERHERNVEACQKLPDNFITLGRVYRPLTNGNHTESEIYCWDCDSRLHMVLLDDTVTFVDGSEYWDIAERESKKEGKADKYGWRFSSMNQIPKCELQKYDLKDKTIRTEIEVTSGDLIFANFFLGKKGKDKNGYEKHSLYDWNKQESLKVSGINSILGRILLAKHYETLNVGYGQMGNMSTDVWVKNDGTEIILGKDYHYDGDKETSIKHKGFKHLGSISLSVWRWMCADKTILDAHKEKLPPKLKPNSKDDDNCEMGDYIWAKVKPGKWVIEHYYDLQGDQENIIHSRLYLKK